MSKPLLGVILGAILGAIDGLTAWFTPAVRDELAGIVVGSAAGLFEFVRLSSKTY